MSESDKSLLPGNLSQLERDLAGALSRISDIDIPISKLWNPDLCPVELLPYLAWALRVDRWRSDWTETQKREVVRQAIDINRTRGTRGAVERVIKAIRGDEVSLKEWFEDKENLAKGTFRVDVKSINQPVDISELQALVPSIHKAKNTRSHLTGFTVTSQVKNPEKHIAMSRQGNHIRSGPWVISSMVSSSSSAMACLSRVAVVVRSGPLPLILE
ncbi:phage tail protein I [Vibrio parahaemolyticus]|uniref:phage tail protein I n=1 Tax=Vibrio parahaemolyticus TaxID=670 RepID=UPI001FACE3B8|nr:phage tail protein I [Vibrio parahaemolyticus]